MSFLPSWTFISVLTLQQILAVSWIVGNISPHIALVSLAHVEIHIVWRLGLENSAMWNTSICLFTPIAWRWILAAPVHTAGAHRLCMHEWIHVVSFFSRDSSATSGPRHLLWEYSNSFRDTTLGRTPLEEWSAPLTDLYLTTRNL